MSLEPADDLRPARPRPLAVDAEPYPLDLDLIALRTTLFYRAAVRTVDRRPVSEINGMLDVEGTRQFLALPLAERRRWMATTGLDTSHFTPHVWTAGALLYLASKRLPGESLYGVPAEARPVLPYPLPTRDRAADAAPWPDLPCPDLQPEGEGPEERPRPDPGPPAGRRPAEAQPPADPRPVTAGGLVSATGRETRPAQEAGGSSPAQRFGPNPYFADIPDRVRVFARWPDAALERDAGLFGELCRVVARGKPITDWQPDELSAWNHAARRLPPTRGVSP